MRLPAQATKHTEYTKHTECFIQGRKPFVGYVLFVCFAFHPSAGGLPRKTTLEDLRRQTTFLGNIAKRKKAAAKPHLEDTTAPSCIYAENLDVMAMFRNRTWLVFSTRQGHLFLCPDIPPEGKRKRQGVLHVQKNCHFSKTFYPSPPNGGCKGVTGHGKCAFPQAAAKNASQPSANAA